MPVFSVTASRVLQVPTVMTARVKASTVMRTFEERVILKAHQEQTVVLELQVRRLNNGRKYRGCFLTLPRQPRREMCAEYRGCFLTLPRQPRRKDVRGEHRVYARSMSEVLHSFFRILGSWLQSLWLWRTASGSGGWTRLRSVSA